MVWEKDSRTTLKIRLAATALLLSIPEITLAQDPVALARDPALFLNTAQKMFKWNEPAEPTRIVGPLYFVGTKGLGVYLVTTSEGHILINTGMPGSGPMIADSIRKLGFKPEDIKIMLAGHAHVDHVGGHAYVQKFSGARTAMIAEEVDLIQSGGKLDFHYGAYREFAFDPVKVDQVLHDGDTIKLGDVAVTARLTPGHTKGSTTFITNLVDQGKVYTVVLPTGTSINPGYRLVKDPSYPGIADDYRRTFHVLEMLKPDIWLEAHTDAFNFEAKRLRAEKEGVRAWVDPEGYRKHVVAVREKFEATVNAEMEGPATVR
jgi:metallo-beta-lactamase class B